MTHMAGQDAYLKRRTRIETYFDQTALQAWKDLTSDAPVSGVRATVRAGRDQMRQMLLDRLPADLSGQRLLDAGCGSGALSVEAARRGAEVIAVDVSGQLIDLARDRAPQDLPSGAIDFRVGDMLDPSFGSFDHVVCMDSLIHYETKDALAALTSLAERTHRTIQFTFAPSTTALRVMHAVGQLFPKGNRSPSIVPTKEASLRRQLGNHDVFAQWRIGRSDRVVSGFYVSQAMELCAP